MLSSLPTEDFLNSSDEIERFMKTIKTCEMALFAGMDNSTAMQETYDETLDLLATVESSIK